MVFRIYDIKILRQKFRYMTSRFMLEYQLMFYPKERKDIKGV